MNLDPSERFAWEITIWAPELSVMYVHTCLHLIILYGLWMKTCSWDPAVMLRAVPLSPNKILPRGYGTFMIHDFVNHKIIFPLTPSRMDVHSTFRQEDMVAPRVGTHELALRTGFVVSRLRDFFLFPHMH